jgi:DNA repair exonuclease SbcCD nuclease subunit
MKYTKITVLLVLLVAVFASFGLAQNDASTFHFVVVGDLQQPRFKGDYQAVTYRIIREIAAADADFVVIAGDCVRADKATEEDAAQVWRQFDALVQPVRAAGKAIWAVPGNHDMWRPSVAHGFDERFGKRYQVFVHKQTGFILLDSESDRTSVAFRYLGWPQWRWLRTEPWRDATAGDPTLLFAFIHRPVFRAEIGLLDFAGHDQLDLAHFLARHRFAAVFAGHEHLYEHREVDGVQYFITGGGGGRLLPTGFHHYLLVTADPRNRTFQVQVQRVH